MEEPITLEEPIKPAEEPPKTIDEPIKTYCVACKQRTESLDMKQVTTKNGRPMLKGTCSSCGSGKTTFKLMENRNAPKQMRTKSAIVKEIQKLKDEKEELKEDFKANGKGPLKAVKRINKINIRMAKVLEQLKAISIKEDIPDSD